MKLKTIIRLDEDNAIDLRLFDKFLDISKIAYYSLEPQEEGNLELKFYDAEKELITLFVS